MKTINDIDRRKVKVLHIITIFSLGGATENTLLSVEGLQELGYDVGILTGHHIDSEGSLFDRAERNNIRVEVIRELQRNIHPLYDIIAFFKIFWKLRREQYHIVHTHSSKAGFIGRLAAWFAGVPIIVHTIHGLPFHDYQSRIARQLFIRAERLGAHCSHKLISVTDTIIRKALQAGVGRPEQYITIRSGFEMHQFLDTTYDVVRLRHEFGFSQKDKIVGKIARFSPLKGHSYLLAAIPEVVKKVPDAKFFLVGSGELENEFKQQVVRLGLSNNVVFAGLVPQERIPEMIAIMDIIVHTSLLEGLARVLPQALASGKPTVSFDIDGAQEVVHDHITGFLIKPKDQHGLAGAIIDILTHEEIAKKFGEEGKKTVKVEWTKEAMVANIDRQYQQLLSSQSMSGIH